MIINKQVGLIVLLAASLLGNLFQIVRAQNEHTYAELGRNFVQSEARAEINKIELNGGCGTIGALQSQADGALTCSPNKVWGRALCAQKGMITKDDFGLILACDGTYWRDARNQLGRKG